MELINEFRKNFYPAPSTDFRDGETILFLSEDLVPKFHAKIKYFDPVTKTLWFDEVLPDTMLAVTRG